MAFDLGDIDNITQVNVYVNIKMQSVNINDIANEKYNQPSKTACRYRRYALSSLLKPLSHRQCQIQIRSGFGV